MQFVHDPEANALYIHLANKPYSHGRDLDAERRIDYAADDTPIGVELTCVRSGIRLGDLPRAKAIAKVLKDLNLPAFSLTGRIDGLTAMERMI